MREERPGIGGGIWGGSGGGGGSLSCHVIVSFIAPLITYHRRLALLSGATTAACSAARERAALAPPRGRCAARRSGDTAHQHPTAATHLCACVRAPRPFTSQHGHRACHYVPVMLRGTRAHLNQLTLRPPDARTLRPARTIAGVRCTSRLHITHAAVPQLRVRAQRAIPYTYIKAQSTIPRTISGTLQSALSRVACSPWLFAFGMLPHLRLPTRPSVSCTPSRLPHSDTCLWRRWHDGNFTGITGYTYGIETLMHELMLQSEHRCDRGKRWERCAGPLLAHRGGKSRNRGCHRHQSSLA